jgi:hypothetical protein
VEELKKNENAAENEIKTIQNQQAPSNSLALSWMVFLCVSVYIKFNDKVIKSY